VEKKSTAEFMVSSSKNVSTGAKLFVDQFYFEEVERANMIELMPNFDTIIHKPVRFQYVAAARRVVSTTRRRWRVPSSLS
jgi:hypothetical protein